MGNKSSFMLQDEEINLISEETGFSASQIERLYSRFTALDKDGNGSLSRQDCLAIPELAINPLCDRIVHMFFIDCDDDHDRINFRQFMKVLATFLSSNHQRKASTIYRQESLSRKQKQSLCHQAPLLFDTIDPTPFSRHSSFHDGFHHDHHYPHNTTNQHSVHYAASSNHLPSLTNGWNHHHHGSFNGLNVSNNSTPAATTTTTATTTTNGATTNDSIKSTTISGTLHESGSSSSINNGLNGLGLFKRPSFNRPLIDPDEPANSRKQKLYFMFKIYDVNGDDLIDLDDLIGIIKMMVGTYVDDTRVTRIAERTLREADKNCDGYIDFEEFSNSFTRKDVVESLKVKFPHS